MKRYVLATKEDSLDQSGPLNKTIKNTMEFSLFEF